MNTPNPNPANSFEVALREVGDGGTLNEASECLAQILAAARLTGKPASLVIKLTAKPASRGEVAVIMMESDVTMKLPRIERPATIFYVGEDNRLHRSDPRQKEFALREVAKPAAEVLKEAAAPTAIAAIA